MHEVRRINAKDGSFIIVYLEDGNSSHQLELTWLREMDRPCDLGDNEFHLALKWMTMKPPTNAMKKWGLSVTKTPKWEFTL